MPGSGVGECAGQTHGVLTVQTELSRGTGQEQRFWSKRKPSGAQSLRTRCRVHIQVCRVTHMAHDGVPQGRGLSSAINREM